jgi:hypothetical protein
VGSDPWSIGDIGILDNNQLANGPGISCCLNVDKIPGQRRVQLGSAPRETADAGALFAAANSTRGRAASSKRQASSLTNRIIGL